MGKPKVEESRPAAASAIGLNELREVVADLLRLFEAKPDKFPFNVAHYVDQTGAAQTIARLRGFVRAMEQETKK